MEGVARGVCGAIVLSLVLGAAPTTQSTSTTQTSSTNPGFIPTTQERQKEMVKWFAALSHADPRERDAGRLALLTLEREDLPALHKLIEDSKPLSPSQRAALHDIVMHVYLSGADYIRSNKGFLGVHLSTSYASVAVEGNEDETQPMRGAIIVDRVPGFAGYRAFQDGDVVLSIKERPDVTIQSKEDLQAVVMSAPAGTVLHMQVVRKMREIELTITLDARPEGDVEEETNVREKEGEDYWQQEFAPIVNGGLW
jgi:hypothetical protein